MKLTFLGTGTSFGVPVIGCDCATCTSTDPRDRRTRHGAVVEMAGGRLLVDTPPELRLQLIAAGIRSIDAVWFTHVHADHIHGIDDVRVFTVVAECKSVSKAAHVLRVTPGMVSRRLDDLEAALDVRLFTRTSAGMVLTPAGADMLDRALSMRRFAEAIYRAAGSVSV